MVTVQDTRVEPGIAARVMRGLELVDRVEAHGDLYTVESSRGSFFYTVCLTHDTYGETCSCPDWKINVLDRGEQDHRCKHIYACTTVQARS